MKKIICENCKKETNDSDKFCTHCGSQFLNDTLMFRSLRELRDFLIKKFKQLKTVDVREIKDDYVIVDVDYLKDSDLAEKEEAFVEKVLDDLGEKSNVEYDSNNEHDSTIFSVWIS